MNAAQVKGSHSTPANVARVGAVVVAVLLTSGLVIQRSESAFSDKEQYGVNHFDSANVNLDSDGVTVSPFSMENAVPGPDATVTKCVTVTYTGSVTPSSDIKMYATKTGPFYLAPYLDTTIEIGAAGATCAEGGGLLFTGTLASFANTHTDFDNGLSTVWTPTSTADKVRPFRFTVTLKDDNAAQDKSADMSFVWEVQS